MSKNIYYPILRQIRRGIGNELHVDFDLPQSLVLQRLLGTLKFVCSKLYVVDAKNSAQWYNTILATAWINLL